MADTKNQVNDARAVATRPADAPSRNDAGRFRLFSIGEVLRHSPPDWRVDGLLPVGAFSMLFAAPAQLKTFFALDVALSVAAGVPFHGKAVRAGPCVYILGEGRSGLKQRVSAWLRARRISNVDKAFFVLEAVQFHRANEVKELERRLGELSVKPSLIVIDTFARNAVGVDENDAREVGLWVHDVTTFKESLGCDVMMLHHTVKAKGNQARERGSGALFGAIDTAIRLVRKGDVLTAKCEKQKDAEEFAPHSFAIESVSLGPNENGAPSSSLVLRGDSPAPSDEDDGSSDGFFSSKQIAVLAQLVVAPQETLTRKELIAATGFADRTLDNVRGELQRRGAIESTERGVYRLKSGVAAAIANLLPKPISPLVGPQVVATSTPPLGGGMAMTMAGDDADNGRGSDGSRHTAGEDRITCGDLGESAPSVVRLALAFLDETPSEQGAAL